MKKIKHFYTTLDYTQKELLGLISLALTLKKGKISSLLSGKNLALLFFNPSLRTRVSFASAMYKLGGTVFDLAARDALFAMEFGEKAVMNHSTIEHVKEGAAVLSRYIDALAVRASDLVTSESQSVTVPSWVEVKKDTVVNSFMKYATVPVINMESNVWHPCQGLGDMMTIIEKLTKPKRKKFVLMWAYHPKALPMATPNSQILAACDLGMDVVVAHPAGWELDRDIFQKMSQRAGEAGGSLSSTNSLVQGLQDARIVCVKSWGALQYYSHWEKEKPLREQHKDWILDQKNLEVTKKALVMHCLPVRRNVEIADEVLDGPHSIVLDEAENRMWVQMAILLALVEKSGDKKTTGGFYEKT